MHMTLNGQWKMRCTESTDWLVASVPGTVYSDLLASEKAQNAYYRANETEIQSLFEKDYEYVRSFVVDEDIRTCDTVMLCCDGLDTLASITLNGSPVADTDNMHRSYRFDVKDLLHQGDNEIRILFRSPVQFVRKIEKENSGAKGLTYLRKASCMFGWDWGLSLPDSGIWRDIYLEGFNMARLADVFVLQHHSDNQVMLEMQTELERYKNNALDICFMVSDPTGKVLYDTRIPVKESDNLTFIIQNPQLWWPTGQGKQPLYRIKVTLMDGTIQLDSKDFKIGLRRITLLRKKDEGDYGYAFEVNGRPIFAKGANLVIPDAVISRRSRNSFEKIIRDSIAANFNCIRVWGGAFYPDSYFYDLCDEYGILLFHDFMFACNFYPADSTFLENVRAEVTDNLKRARNHASIALWCGSNEIESCLHAFSDPTMRDLLEKLGAWDMLIPFEAVEPLRANIKTLFYELIEPLAKELAPQTSYTATSPVGDKPFEFSQYSGDAHYYLAYDNMQPYEHIRELDYRFLTEIGFQSYPDYKTICAFTEESDRSPYSEVMLQHQKCNNGNQTLETYLDRDYQVPADFKKYVYATQTLSATITSYSIEHFRRRTGHCMGYLVWQMNDCWPAVSWAGIDYYGRWKAQQYSLKRSFAPVMVSALDDGYKVCLYVNNDHPNNVDVTVKWSLINSNNQVVRNGEASVEVKPQKAVCAVETDFSDVIVDTKNQCYLAFSAFIDETEVSNGVVLFVKPKEYQFEDPQIQIRVTEQGAQFCVGLTSNTLAYAVALELKHYDAIFSDNYFHLLPQQEKVIRIEKSSISDPLSMDELKTQLTWLTAYDLQ